MNNDESYIRKQGAEEGRALGAIRYLELLRDAGTRVVLVGIALACASVLALYGASLTGGGLYGYGTGVTSYPLIDLFSSWAMVASSSALAAVLAFVLPGTTSGVTPRSRLAWALTAGLVVGETYVWSRLFMGMAALVRPLSCGPVHNLPGTNGCGFADGATVAMIDVAVRGSVWALAVAAVGSFAAPLVGTACAVMASARAHATSAAPVRDALWGSLGIVAVAWATLTLVGFGLSLLAEVGGYAVLVWVQLWAVLPILAGGRVRRAYARGPLRQ